MADLLMALPSPVGPPSVVARLAEADEQRRAEEIDAAAQLLRGDATAATEVDAQHGLHPDVVAAVADLLAAEALEEELAGRLASSLGVPLSAAPGAPRRQRVYAIVQAYQRTRS